MKNILQAAFVVITPLLAQGLPDRAVSALTERALSGHVARMSSDERVSMYQSMAEAYPENFHYQNLLASAFMQKMRGTADVSYLDRAAGVIRAVLAADGSNYESLRLISVIELERHNFPKVAEYSRELVRRSPEDPWNYGTLGDALMELGRYAEAATAYQKMVNLRPDLASYNRAAYYRFVAGDGEGAIVVMRQAIAAGSASVENAAWCMTDLGNMQFKIGRLDEARRSFEAALRIVPAYHPAHAGLGRVMAAHDRFADAIAHFRKAQAAVPLPEYAGALHDLYKASGDAAEAAKQANLIDVLDSLERSAGGANRNLALVLADQDRKLDRALELARAELAVRGDVYTYDALAWTLYKNRQYAEASEASAKALELGTPEPSFYYHAGMIERALGKREKARLLLEKARRLNSAFDVRQAGIAVQALAEVSE